MKYKHYKIIIIALLLTLYARGQEPLNIVVVSVDDMNCDSVGVFGSVVEDTTPNLDRFASEGFRFAHAHVHASSCIPSRNTVQTGRYMFNSGIEGFYQIPKEKVTYKTTPELLRENGYFTIIRGKSSHSSPYHPFPAWDINFDDELRSKHVNIRDPKSFYEYTLKGVNAAKSAGKPFYFSMDIHDPHTPLYRFKHKKGITNTELSGQDRDNPPSRIFSPDEVVVPDFLPDTPLSRLEVTAYYNSVRRADDSFGSMIQALKDAGVYENTLIVFFSDHGMPFPFAKTALYYHSTHTPLIIRWPGVATHGKTDNTHVIGMVDLLPTLLEAVGIKHPKGLDGRSFASILRGEKQRDRNFAYVMYEENVGGNRQPMRALVSREFSYIFNLWSDGERRFATATRGMATTAEMERLAESGDLLMRERLKLFNYTVPEQFFDIKKDSDCLNNLAYDSNHGQMVKMYRERMLEMMESCNDPIRAIYKIRDEKVAVAEYLAKLDDESLLRRRNAAYSRSGKAKKK